MHADEYRRMFEVEQTHWWYLNLHDLVLDLLNRNPPASATERPEILDAGCGTGQMAVRFAERGAEVTAMDFSPHALELCRERGLTRLVGGSVNALPFDDASFDTVVSLDVLCHVSVEEDQAARELARVLRPGGTLVLNLPAYNWLRGQHDVVVHTARRYSRRRVRALLARAGLEVVSVGHWNTFLFPLAAAVRLASRWRMRGDDAPSDVGPVHPLVNRTLRVVLAAERAVMRRVPLPFGLSVIAVARRPRN